MADGRISPSGTVQCVINCEFLSTNAIRRQVCWAPAISEAKSIPKSTFVEGKTMFIDGQSGKLSSLRTRSATTGTVPVSCDHRYTAAVRYKPHHTDYRLRLCTLPQRAHVDKCPLARAVSSYIISTINVPLIVQAASSLTH